MDLNLHAVKTTHNHNHVVDITIIFRLKLNSLNFYLMFLNLIKIINLLEI